MTRSILALALLTASTVAWADKPKDHPHAQRAQYAQHDRHDRDDRYEKRSSTAYDRVRENYERHPNRGLSNAQLRIERNRACQQNRTGERCLMLTREIQDQRMYRAMERRQMRERRGWWDEHRPERRFGDLNNDGVISREEHARMASYRFDRADINNDGVINQEDVRLRREWARERERQRDDD